MALLSTPTTPTPDGIGYTVIYVMRWSGYSKKVYWAPNFDEALAYAEWIARNFGASYGVTVVKDIGGRVAKWNMPD